MAAAACRWNGPAATCSTPTPSAEACDARRHRRLEVTPERRGYRPGQGSHSGQRDSAFAKASADAAHFRSSRSILRDETKAGARPTPRSDNGRSSSTTVPHHILVISFTYGWFEAPRSGATIHQTVVCRVLALVRTYGVAAQSDTSLQYPLFAAPCLSERSLRMPSVRATSSHPHLLIILYFG